MKNFSIEKAIVWFQNHTHKSSLNHQEIWKKVTAQTWQQSVSYSVHGTKPAYGLPGILTSSDIFNRYASWHPSWTEIMANWFSATFKKFKSVKKFDFPKCLLQHLIYFCSNFPKSKTKIYATNCSWKSAIVNVVSHAIYNSGKMHIKTKCECLV